MTSFRLSAALTGAAVFVLATGPALAAQTGEMNAPAAETPAQAVRLAQSVTEKEAFEAAKELGTIEAWEAFLENFPKGFRADLARAYVRRLGNGQKETAPEPQQAAPAQTQSPQLAAQPPQPQLQPVHRGPGSTSWRNGAYSLDEGNASAFSASVEAGGLELTTYCNNQNRLSAVLGESRRGVYPDFDQRVAQGLEASRAQYGAQNQHISVRYSNGAEELIPAHVMGLTGEVALNQDQNGNGFHPQGSFATNLMGEKTVTLSAPPFGVTFQLTNSRASICKVFTRCGVNIQGCARYQPRPVSTQPQGKVVRKKPRGCPGGTIFLEGKCIPRSQAASFCGPGYRVQGSKCVSQAGNPQPAQQPAQTQNAPPALQILQGIAGAIQQQKNQQQRKCPPGKVWEVNSCVEDD